MHFINLFNGKWNDAIGGPNIAIIHFFKDIVENKKEKKKTLWIKRKILINKEHYVTIER